jgi:plasmid stability protein
MVLFWCLSTLISRIVTADVTTVPNLTLKNLPERLLETLRQRAAAHRRSLNSEILNLLEEAVLPRRLDPEELLARIDQMHHRIDAVPPTDDEFAKAKRRGRS